jgi:hypothetical protein
VLAANFEARNLPLSAVSLATAVAGKLGGNETTYTRDIMFYDMEFNPSLRASTILRGADFPGFEDHEVFSEATAKALLEGKVRDVHGGSNLDNKFATVTNLVNTNNAIDAVLCCVTAESVDNWVIGRDLEGDSAEISARRQQLQAVLERKWSQHEMFLKVAKELNVSVALVITRVDYRHKLTDPLQQHPYPTLQHLDYEAEATVAGLRSFLSQRGSLGVDAPIAATSAYSHRPQNCAPNDADVVRELSVLRALLAAFPENASPTPPLFIDGQDMEPIVAKPLSASRLFPLRADPVTPSTDTPRPRKF